jgi:hypothetical protein
MSCALSLYPTKILNIDGLVKSRKVPFFVIPANRRCAETALYRIAKAEAGIHYNRHSGPASSLSWTTIRDAG